MHRLPGAVCMLHIIFIFSGGLADRAVDNSLHGQVVELASALKSLEEQARRGAHADIEPSIKRGQTLGTDLAPRIIQQLGTHEQHSLAAEDEKQVLLSRPNSLVQELYAKAQSLVPQLQNGQNGGAAAASTAETYIKADPATLQLHTIPAEYTEVRNESVLRSEERPSGKLERRDVTLGNNVDVGLAQISAEADSLDDIPELQMSNLNAILKQMHGYVREFKTHFVGENAIQVKAGKAIGASHHFFKLYNRMDTGFNNLSSAIHDYRVALKDSQSKTIDRTKGMLNPDQRVKEAVDTFHTRLERGS